MMSEAEAEAVSMFEAWKGSSITHATDGQQAFYAGYQAARARRYAQRALELLFRDLLDETVSLGELQRIVNSVRESIAEGPENDYAPPLTSLAASELAKQLLTDPTVPRTPPER